MHTYHVQIRTSRKEVFDVIVDSNRSSDSLEMAAAIAYLTECGNTIQISSFHERNEIEFYGPMNWGELSDLVNHRLAQQNTVEE